MLLRRVATPKQQRILRQAPALKEPLTKQVPRRNIDVLTVSG